MIDEMLRRAGKLQTKRIIGEAFEAQFNDARLEKTINRLIEITGPTDRKAFDEFWASLGDRDAQLVLWVFALELLENQVQRRKAKAPGMPDKKDLPNGSGDSLAPTFDEFVRRFFRDAVKEIDPAVMKSEWGQLAEAAQEIDLANPRSNSHRDADEQVSNAAKELGADAVRGTADTATEAPSNEPAPERLYFDLRVIDSIIPHGIGYVVYIGAHKPIPVRRRIGNLLIDRLARIDDERLLPFVSLADSLGLQR